MKIHSLSPIAIIIGMILTGMIACSNTSTEKNKINGSKNKHIVPSAWNAPEGKALGQLGNRLTTLLLKPKKVEMYTVAYQDSINKEAVYVEPNFAIDSLICRLNKEQIATLNFILTSDTSNYSLNRDAIPMIPHRPQWAFVFQDKKENAIIWYSPCDFTWGIRYDGRDIFYYSVNHPSLMSSFCNRINSQKK